MFYDTQLMSSNIVGTAWCCAHNQRVRHVDGLGMKEMCSAIEKSIGDGVGRQSLRTSAVLVNGAARYYKNQLDTLYNDCIKLEDEMIIRRHYTPDVTEDEDEEHSTTNNSVTDSSIRKRRNTKSNTRESSRDTSLSERTKRSRSSNDENRHTNTSKDAAVQTDSRVPFGVVLVYDNGPHVPSKIICSKLNSGVRFI